MLVPRMSSITHALLHDIAQVTMPDGSELSVLCDVNGSYGDLLQQVELVAVMQRVVV